jgi:hypothetical protein
MDSAHGGEHIETGGLELRAGFQRALQTVEAVLAGAAVCALVFLGLDLMAPHMKSKRPQPFLWASQGDGATVFFGREPVLKLRGQDGSGAAARARRLANSLGSLFSQLDPPRLEVAADRPETASVRAGGVLLIEIESADTEGQRPLPFARNWVRRIEPLVRGKGAEADGCPACHIERLDQVLRESRIHSGRKW